MIPVIAAGIAFVWGLASGCGGSDDADTTKPQPDTDVPPRPDATGDAYVADSADGYIGNDADAFIPSPDADSDTDTSDVGPDLPPDLEVSGPDTDAVSDTTTGPDADTTSDVGPDTEPDVVPDTKPDTQTDNEISVQPDTTPDVAPDVDTSVPPDDGPDVTEVDVVPVNLDKDNDGFDVCTSSQQSDWLQGAAVLCDCNDNNFYVNPAAPQGTGEFDSNCDGSNVPMLIHDAAKFISSDPNHVIGDKNFVLGDFDHDGIADVAIGVWNYKAQYGMEGGVFIFLSSKTTLEPGVTYDIADADASFMGPAGSAFGAGLAALPQGTDNNGDDVVNESDFCDLVIDVPGYDSNVLGGIAGDGTGLSGYTSAVMYVEGRKKWDKLTTFYNVSGKSDAVVVDGYNSEDLAAHKMGILTYVGGGFNISYDSGALILAESNSATINFIKAKKFYGIDSVENARFTLFQDFNKLSSIYELGLHAYTDIDGDGIPDFLGANSASSNNGKYFNGRIWAIKGKLENPSEIRLPNGNLPPVDGDKCPIPTLKEECILPYYTLSGSLDNDNVGSGILPANLNDTPANTMSKVDLVIGALGQSFQTPLSGCAPIWTDMTPDFFGQDIILNSGLVLLGGLVLDGANPQSYMTNTNALRAINPSRMSHSLLFIGTPRDPISSRVNIVDVGNLQQQLEAEKKANPFGATSIESPPIISTNNFRFIEGPRNFGDWISNGARGVRGGENVLISAPKDVSHPGAIYLFFGVAQNQATSKTQ